MEQSNMEIKIEQKIEEDCLNDLKQEDFNAKQEEIVEKQEEPTLIPPLNRKSRKIQKKREKYQKIDDNIRLQLLDAVHKDGELLKTVLTLLSIIITFYNRLQKD